MISPRQGKGSCGTNAAQEWPQGLLNGSLDPSRCKLRFAGLASSSWKEVEDESGDENAERRHALGGLFGMIGRWFGSIVDPAEDMCMEALQYFIACDRLPPLLICLGSVPSAARRWDYLLF